MSKKVVFKPYVQNQPSLLPPSYEDLVPANHPVRVVNEIIERIDLSELERTYKGGGTSSYHPRMLLKVIIYAYLRNIYSSRKIEQALEENVHFMWLSGGSRPDHNTINDFRGKRLKEQLKKIFNQVVILLAEEGVLSLKELLLDGTKLEANANRYSFVWGKSIKTSRARIEEQLQSLWRYVEELYQDEENQPTKPEMAVLDPEDVTRTIEAINEALKDKVIEAKVKQKLAYGKKSWPQKLAQYTRQEQLLAGRNSMSKTDPAATFMRMKEDHMKNGQLKPGYNVQASTNRHYIINYTIGQTTADTTEFKNHLEEYLNSYGAWPHSVATDAGYGSQENYQYLEENRITGFVKYPGFDKQQQTKKDQTNPFLAANLYYNEETDTYYCPIGQPMHFIGIKEQTTKTGYKQELRRYRAVNCEGCPLRSGCHRGTGNRIIERNPKLIRYREQARELLESEEGVESRKQRWESEGVFGNIKQNHGFRRFMLRGKEKVTVETGLIALAHNLRRYAKRAH